MCEQDTHIQEVVLRAVQRLGFANPRPQQMEAIKTFILGKDVFVSVANWIRQTGPSRAGTGPIVLPGPIKLMVPIGMGAVDIKYHTGGKYIAFVYWPGPLSVALTANQRRIQGGVWGLQPPYSYKVQAAPPPAFRIAGLNPPF